MFGQQKRVRRLAAHVLLVWLFALTSGTVNACRLEPGLRHEAILVTQDRHAGAQALRHDERTAGAVGHEREAPAADNAPCAKFCDEQSTCAPVAKQSDHPSAVWLAPPPTVSFAVQTANEPAAAWLAEHGRLHARIPIPIAFLRLTL